MLAVKCKMLTSYKHNIQLVHAHYINIFFFLQETQKRGNRRAIIISTILRTGWLDLVAEERMQREEY